MSDHKTGSCLCGAVKFTVTGPLRPVIACHCRQCRKQTGNYMSATGAKDEYLKLTETRGLKWYRSRTEGRYESELQLFSGRAIDVPAIFIAGKSDWGTYQRPGNFERQQSACTRMMGCHLIDGAGHWVQQEQPQRVSELLIEFLQLQ